MSYCSKCGAALNADGRFCPSCGGANVTDTPPPAPTTSGAAVASLVFGILFFFPFAPIIAVILGHVARRRIKRSNGALQGDGIALAGLVLGYLVIFCGLLALPMVLSGHRD